MPNNDQFGEYIVIRNGKYLTLKYLKIFELKIYRGVMCPENEEWCKNWRGIDFSVQNWHEQFDKLWFKHPKISKLSTLMGCL